MLCVRNLDKCAKMSKMFAKFFEKTESVITESATKAVAEDTRVLQDCI